MVRRGVDRVKLGREIELKIRAEKSVKWRTKAFAEEVATYLKTVAWPTATGSVTGPGHPYETGAFVESIEVVQNRNRLGRFLAGFTVQSNSPNANFIEYGTDIDKPGSKSPWGPNTPTPEYAPFARTAHHFGGTADG